MHSDGWVISHFICESCGERLEADTRGLVKGGCFSCLKCGCYQLEIFYRKAKNQKY